MNKNTQTHRVTAAEVSRGLARMFAVRTEQFGSLGDARS